MPHCSGQPTLFAACPPLNACRLLCEEGLSFRFEHDQNAQAGDIPLESAASHARHKLAIFDRDSALPVGRQAVKPDLPNEYKTGNEKLHRHHLHITIDDPALPFK